MNAPYQLTEWCVPNCLEYSLLFIFNKFPSVKKILTFSMDQIPCEMFADINFLVRTTHGTKSETKYVKHFQTLQIYYLGLALKSLKWKIK